VPKALGEIAEELGIVIERGRILCGLPLGVVFAAEVILGAVLGEEMGGGGMAGNLLTFDFDLALTVAAWAWAGIPGVRIIAAVAGGYDASLFAFGTGDTERRRNVAPLGVLGRGLAICFSLVAIAVITG
jgi:hypothetical protein